MQGDIIGRFWSKEWGEVVALATTYTNGALAVQLAAGEEPLATLSVNMYRPECSEDSTDLPDGCFYVKTWGENAQIAAEALKSGLFIERPDLGEALNGYVSAPAWEIKFGGPRT